MRTAPEDPDGAVDATLGELQGQVDQLEASSAAVADYAAATCGLQLGPGSSSGTTVPVPGTAP